MQILPLAFGLAIAAMGSEPVKGRPSPQSCFVTLPFINQSMNQSIFGKSSEVLRTFVKTRNSTMC